MGQLAVMPMRPIRPCFLIAVFFAVHVLHAQQTSTTGPGQILALEPLIFSDGTHAGELDLSVDVNSGGQVSTATVISGDARLQSLALKTAKLIRHPNYASKTAIPLHVDAHERAATMEISPPGKKPGGPCNVMLLW